MAKIFEYAGLEYEVPDDTTLAEFESFINEKEASERSSAMGGPWQSEADREVAEAQDKKKAQERDQANRLAVPPIFAPAFYEGAALQKRIKDQTRVSAPATESEKELAEAQKGVIPFFRPTRIAEIARPAPYVDYPSIRVIQEEGPLQGPLLEPVESEPPEMVTRTPTPAEEYRESFARQPVLTREAGRQLASGIPADRVNKKQGELEGAVIESPMMAMLRGIPASAERIALDFYRGLPIAGDEPVTGNVPELMARTAQGAAEALGAETVAGALGKASKIARKGTVIPLISLPAPSALEDIEPAADAIRKGAMLEDVILGDPATMREYEIVYGPNAEVAARVVGFGASLLTPFSPLGYARPLVSPAIKGATKGAEALAAYRAKGVVQAAERGGTPAASLQRFARSAEREVLQTVQRGDPLTAKGQEYIAARERYANWVAQAQRDLGRAAPRPEELVRVSPSYAAPKGIADAIKREAAAEVKALVDAAKETGQQVTPALIRAARDRAVERSFSAQAKRLSEIGQFQVALHGAVPQRFWNSRLANAIKTIRAPRQAMRPASVVAAEEEVRRKGTSAIRGLRKEVAKLAKDGQNLDQIITTIAQRELKDLRPGETLRKVIEEGYGGERAKEILPYVIEGIETGKLPADEIFYLTPTGRADLHRYLRESRQLDLPIMRPPIANAIKIIVDEGLKKRVSQEAKDTYIKTYGSDSLLSSYGVARYNPLSPTIPLGIPPENIKFAENGAEELFRLIDQIPAGPAGALPTSATEGLKAIQAAYRNFATKNILTAPVKIAGEAIAGPIRALLTTGYLPAEVMTILRGGSVKTPYGTLSPRLLDDMIDDLGGFGPSRMDISRKGMLVADILRSATHAAPVLGRKAPVFGLSEGRVADLALGEPYAVAAVNLIEETYRKGAFIAALQRGAAPEEAIEIARRSQLDYGAEQIGLVEELGEYWAGALLHAAFYAEFADRVAKAPQRYGQYLKTLKRIEKELDPEGELGDAALERIGVIPVSSIPLLGIDSEVQVLGPQAPALAPVQDFLLVAKAIDILGTAAKTPTEAPADALDWTAEQAAWFSDVAGGVAELIKGSAPKAEPPTQQRGNPSVDQAYEGLLAFAQTQPEDSGFRDLAWRILSPDPVQAPEGYRVPGAGPYSWGTKPPKTPGAFIIEQPSNPGTYWVAKPSKRGRRNLQAILAAPLVGGDAKRVLSAYSEYAEEPSLLVPTLWYLGAETADPTEVRRGLVEQTRPK